jgi:ribosome-associated protein
VIKAQATRSQEQNREEALKRLQALVKSVAVVQKRRLPTKPTKGSKLKRVDGKTKRGQLKNLRSNVDY